MHLTLGFSPCPNDTFIFDALVNKKIDTAGFTFDVIPDDVETLNKWALDGRLDITKLSYGVLPLVLDKYAVLNSGSALGKAVGPLLIRKHEINDLPIESQWIAIPGEHTTAHMLFSMAYPGATKKVFMRYDQVEDFVLAGKGLGVIIHENRFTYADKGLHKVTDLGDHWERETGMPIPLGGIVIKRALGAEVSAKVEKLIRESIEYAYSNHYKELADYVKIHSQEMEEAVMRKHIDLYVNAYSVELGESGRAAIGKFIDVYCDMHPGAVINKDNIFA